MANIINLNGTSWSIPAGWTTLNGYGSYEFSGQFQMAENPPALDFSGLYMGYEYESGLVADIDRIAIYVDDSHLYEPEYSNLTPNDAFLILNISNATAEESASFYDWLIANNATLTGGEPVVPKTPTITYDLTKLNLAAGTYNITVVAKAEGYKNSVASEAVEYVVAEAQDELQGAWVLNKTVQPYDGDEKFYVDATCYYVEHGPTLTKGKVDYFRIDNVPVSYFNIWFPNIVATNHYYDSNGYVYGYDTADDEWEYSPDSDDGVKLRTLTITSKLAEVTNGAELLTWLKANATKQDATTPTLITFTVGSTTYQAEEDMTWYEWCNSEYNTSSFVCTDPSYTVWGSSNYMNHVARNDETNVAGSDYIINGETYILKHVTSND